MTDDLVSRLRIIGAWKTPGGPLPSEEMIKPHLTCEEAADRIEQLEYALHSIAEVILGAAITDCTTIWGLATYMQETLQLICRCCDTIFDVCTMPTDIDAVVKAINASTCPTCSTSGRTSHLYVGEKK